MGEGEGVGVGDGYRGREMDVLGCMLYGVVVVASNGAARFRLGILGKPVKSEHLSGPNSGNVSPASW